MKTGITATLVLALASNCWASDVPSTPRPRAAFDHDNAGYALMGTFSTGIVGSVSNRPWIGLTAGIATGAIGEFAGIDGNSHKMGNFGYDVLGSVATYAVLKVLKGDWRRKRAR